MFITSERLKNIISNTTGNTTFTIYNQDLDTNIRDKVPFTYIDFCKGALRLSNFHEILRKVSLEREVIFCIKILLNFLVIYVKCVLPP